MSDVKEGMTVLSESPRSLPTTQSGAKAAMNRRTPKTHGACDHTLWTPIRQYLDITQETDMVPP
jgi:hypothetical protein